METKFCTKCGIEKPATAEWFSRQKSGKDGLRANCKECRKIIYQNNKEHVKYTSKKYKQENKESTKLYADKYRKNNKKKSEEWRKDNKENIKKRMSAYCKENLDSYKIYNQTRRALAQSLPSTLTLSEWQSTKEHFNHECAYCGKKLKNLAQDHVIPLSKGGGYTKGNIIPSCKSCNNSKRASNMKAWYTTGPYFSIERYNKILAFIKKHKSVLDHTPLSKGVIK